MHGKRRALETVIGPLHDLVTWHGINYAGTQKPQWDFQNKGTRTSPARLSFVLKVPLHCLYMCPSIIYSDHVTESCKRPIIWCKHYLLYLVTNMETKDFLGFPVFMYAVIMFLYMSVGIYENGAKELKPKRPYFTLISLNL